MRRLEHSFYERDDVVTIAKELLGKIIVTKFNGLYTSARIVESEAYAGVGDRASHAFGGRRTKRTEVMYSQAGTAYVYLCYGIHHLFNVVTNKKDIPHAILIRAAEPLKGVDIMLERTGKKEPDFSLARGPGNVSKALGIFTGHTGMSLQGQELFIASDDYPLKEKNVVASPRIGVDYAGQDAALAYRFFLRGNPYVSGKTNFVRL